ncbi:MAG: Ig-like domain-containing protein [Clostridia bacterium]|nr:Ig-like domain-containing protein [Clostridia bacterium]
MKKSTKKILMTSVLASFALTTALGVSVFAMPKAEADFSDFTMDAGAGVRMDTPTGIRFTSNVGEKTRASLENATNVTFGMLIAPNMGDDNKLTLDDVSDENIKAKNLVTAVWSDGATSYADTTTYKYYGAIVGGETVDFPEEKYTTALNAVGYVKYTVDSVEYVEYTTSTANRSLAQAAANSLANGVTDTNGVLSGVVDTVVPDALSVGAVEAMEYGAKTTLTAEGTQGLAVIWSSDNTEVATVDKLTGEVTAVGIGTAEITATLGTRTATTTVSVQDKAGVISVAHFATASTNPAGGEIQLVTDETQGTVAKSEITVAKNNKAYWWILAGEQYKYFSGYDYIELMMKADVPSGNADDLRFYPNKTYARESDDTVVMLSELNTWKTVRFNDYSSKTQNADSFEAMNTDKRLAFHIVNSSTSEDMSATIYFAGIVGGYSDFEATQGTAIDLTAKYNGIKSATITPTGSSQAETISDLSAWMPVDGTLSFTVGQTGWFDNSYTVNVSVVDPVGTVSAKTIAQEGTSSVSGATLTTETDATEGTVAVWNVTVEASSWAHLTVENDLYADFANYDYVDFRIKIEPITNTSNNGYLYFNKKDYTKMWNGEKAVSVGYTTIQEWTTVTFRKEDSDHNATAFGNFESEEAVSISLKNNHASRAQEFKVYIAYIQVRNAEA